MSDKRAKKDARDREKGVKRLEKRFASGKITKESVNNRGYNTCFPRFFRPIFGNP
jgi:hypothetical protein